MLDLLRGYRMFIAVGTLSLVAAIVVTIGPHVVAYLQWLAEPATTQPLLCLASGCPPFGPPIPKPPFELHLAGPNWVGETGIDWMQFVILWAVGYAVLTGLILSARALSHPGGGSAATRSGAAARLGPLLTINWGRVLAGVALIAIALGIVAGTSGPTSSTVVLPWGLALVGFFTLVGGFGRGVRH